MNLYPRVFRYTLALFLSHQIETETGSAGSTPSGIYLILRIGIVIGSPYF